MEPLEKNIILRVAAYHFHSTNVLKPDWTSGPLSFLSSQYHLLSPSVSTVWEDILNVQTDTLQHTFAKNLPLSYWKRTLSLRKIHQLTHSQNFDRLLRAVDVCRLLHSLTSASSLAPYSALTQLLVLLTSRNFYLIRILLRLIANNVQDKAASHLGTVLSSFLRHLAQLLLHIIATFDAEDLPLFLQFSNLYSRILACVGASCQESV